MFGLFVATVIAAGIPVSVAINCEPEVVNFECIAEQAQPIYVYND